MAHVTPVAGCRGCRATRRPGPRPSAGGGRPAARVRRAAVGVGATFLIRRRREFIGGFVAAADRAADSAAVAARADLTCSLRSRQASRPGVSSGARSSAGVNPKTSPRNTIWASSARRMASAPRYPCPLPREREVGAQDLPGGERGHEGLGLGRRHDPIVEALHDEGTGMCRQVLTANAWQAERRRDPEGLVEEAPGGGAGRFHITSMRLRLFITATR